MRKTKDKRVVVSVDANGRAMPAWKRHGGFVTQADIYEHGSYAAARAAKDALT